MTNDELDAQYVFLKLAGKLRGVITENRVYDPDENNTNGFYNWYGAFTWESEEDLREMAELSYCDINEDVLIDMPYELWRIDHHLEYLFDLKNSTLGG